MRSLRLLTTLAVVVLSIGLAPGRSFADDPQDLESTISQVSPIRPTPLSATASSSVVFQTTPLTTASPIEVSIQVLAGQLQGLAAQCYPGSIAVTVQALPDDGSPLHYILVSVLVSPGQATSAKLPDFVSACLSQMGASAAARPDVAAIMKTAAAILTP